MLLFPFHKISNSRPQRRQRTTRVAFYEQSISLFCFQYNKSRETHFAETRMERLNSRKRIGRGDWYTLVFRYCMYHGKMIHTKSYSSPLLNMCVINYILFSCKIAIFGRWPCAPPVSISRPPVWESLI